MCARIGKIDVKDFFEIAPYFPETLCVDNVLEDHPAFESMPEKLAELDIRRRNEDGMAYTTEIFVRAIAYDGSFDPKIEKRQIHNGFR